MGARSRRMNVYIVGEINYVTLSSVQVELSGTMEGNRTLRSSSIEGEPEVGDILYEYGCSGKFTISPECEECGGEMLPVDKRKVLCPHCGSRY